MEAGDQFLISLLDSINTNLYRYGGLAICIIGNLGHILSASIFLRKSWRKNVCVFYFLIGMVISTVYLDCTMLGVALMTGFDIPMLNYNVFVCKFFFYITLFASTLGPTVLILAGIDRLLISSQNVETRLYSSRRLAYFSVGSASTFWLLFNVHVLVKVHIQQVGPSNFICYYDLTAIYQDFVLYSLMVFNALFCVSMIILSIFAFKNVRRIRSVPRQQRSRVRSMNKKDFQLLRCLFVQVVVYISCSITPSVFSVYNTITRDQPRSAKQASIIDFLTNCTNIIYYSYHAISFFVFFSVSKAFRQELRNCFCKICGRDLVPLQTEEQNPSDPAIDAKP